MSNPTTLSKILEKIALSQISFYFIAPSSFNKFQSAYNKLHSCEIAFLHITDSLKRAQNNGRGSLLVSLDLSAAFDTVDHHILISRLQHDFKVVDSDLLWLGSYLTNRSQFTAEGKTSSPILPLSVGVPQGSVLGSLLFVIYTSPLAKNFQKYPINFHQYADDIILTSEFLRQPSSSR